MDAKRHAAISSVAESIIHPRLELKNDDDVVVVALSHEFTTKAIITGILIETIGIEDIIPTLYQHSHTHGMSNVAIVNTA